MFCSREERQLLSLDQKCKKIVDCYHQISNCLNANIMKEKKNMEHKHQTVCFLLFHYWKKFKVNVKLHAAVDNQLNVDEAGRNQQKAELWLKQKKASILPPIHIPQPKRCCKQKRLLSPWSTVALQSIVTQLPVYNIQRGHHHLMYNKQMDQSHS